VIWVYTLYSSAHSPNENSNFPRFGLEFIDFEFDGDERLQFPVTEQQVETEVPNTSSRPEATDERRSKHR